MSFPTYPDLVGHNFDDIDGNGYTHRHWMADVGLALDTGGATFPLTTATTIFDDGAGPVPHTVAFDASGAIDSNSGAHFGVDPGTGPGLLINSTGQTSLSLTAAPAWLIGDDAGTYQFQVSTTGTPGTPVTEIAPRANVEALVINSFGGDADAIQYFGPPDFVGEFRVDASGAIGTRGTEPADGDIAAGECFRYFDSTAGAPTIKFKAKDASGDVFTATIPMTPA